MQAHESKVSGSGCFRPRALTGASRARVVNASRTHTMHDRRCFIGIMVLLGDLKSCVSDIAASGLALEELHSAALASRVLDQMHKNKTVVGVACAVS